VVGELGEGIQEADAVLGGGGQVGADGAELFVWAVLVLPPEMSSFPLATV
jgi:hypothetical protein